MGEHLSASQARGLKRAANAKHVKNAERDLHTLFRKEGLCVPLYSNCFNNGVEDVHYISLTSWFPYLLRYHSQLLLGGFRWAQNSSELLLQTFWTNFKQSHPNHAVFDLHEGDRLGRCLPYFLHLDEGTGLRKSAVLVVSFQAVFGLGTYEEFLRLSRVRDLHDRMTQSQQTNSKGSTYLSRFLFTALPKKTYSGKNSEVYWKVLQLLADECKELMTQGIEIAHDVFYPICLGVKGDQPALIKCGHFKRSFMNLGVNKGICWECLAGFDGFPFENCSPDAEWMGTIGLVEPWPADSGSPLLEVPCDRGNRVSFWWRDPFHAFKQTIGGHFAASLIILLAVDFRVWHVPGASNAVTACMERAYDDFRFWVCHEWRGTVVNHIKAFTKEIFHFADLGKFPFARFKGNDQMLLLRWLRQVILHGVFLDGDVIRSRPSLLDNPAFPWQKDFYQAALFGCEGSISFFHTLHRQGVWLCTSTAKAMAMDCLKFCQSYARLAQLSHLRSLARFHLEPSLHTFMHFYVDLTCVNNAKVVLNPACATTEQDEDFVGKIARACRHVHAMTTTQRCIERYLVLLHFEFKRIGKAWDWKPLAVKQLKRCLTGYITFLPSFLTYKQCDMLWWKPFPVLCHHASWMTTLVVNKLVQPIQSQDLRRAQLKDHAWKVTFEPNHNDQYHWYVFSCSDTFFVEKV